MDRELAADSSEPSAKRARLSSPSPSPSPSVAVPSTKPISLHSWLHPAAPPPLLTHSPPLHSHTSTFLAISLSYVPPAHIRTPEAMAKDVKRIVRELDVPSLVGDKLIRDADGAFQDGEGVRRVGGAGGRERVERVREPDHRMWAARGVGLGEGRDGTGEDDFQLIECSEDDGEKYGGDRVLRMMKELGGVDAITVCCRWYGGDMLGPIRFQHIGTTAHTALTLLQKLVQLTELRNSLVELDSDIAGLRSTINAMDGSSRPQPAKPVLGNGADGVGKQKDGMKGDLESGGDAEAPGTGAGTGTGKGIETSRQAVTAAPASAYDKIDDIPRLKRLIAAKTKTRDTLEAKAAWAGADMGADEA